MAGSYAVDKRTAPTPKLDLLERLLKLVSLTDLQDLAEMIEAARDSSVGSRSGGALLAGYAEVRLVFNRGVLRYLQTVQQRARHES